MHVTWGARRKKTFNLCGRAAAKGGGGVAKERYFSFRTKINSSQKNHFRLFFFQKEIYLYM